MYSKNGIVYISISLIISSVVYAIYKYNHKVAVIAAALFLIMAFLFMASGINEYKLVIINFKVIINYIIFVIIFFCIGICNNSLYYKLESNNNFKGDIRIVKKINDSYIADYNGRNVFITDVTGNIKECIQGEKLYVSGTFKKKIDIEYGNLGTINVNSCHKNKDDLITKILKFRISVFNKMKEKIGQRKAALVSSLSYGYSDYLDNLDKEEMKGLGVIHAISVSGLHIALIYGILNKVFNKKVSLIATAVYVIFTGAAFSSIRAFIMISLKVLAVDFRRKYNPVSALALSSVIILIYKPYSIFSVSFLLSFFAVLGIILFYKKIDLMFYKLPEYIRKSVAVSLSAAIFTTPILIYYFETVSLSSVIGNIIIVPILTLIIEIGNTLIIFYYFPKIFNFICFVLTKIIFVLDYIIGICENYSIITIINKQFGIVYFSILIACYFYKKGFKKMKILVYASIMSTVIHFYSPIVNVSCIDNGSFLVSYRGDRKIFSNGKVSDIKLIKNKNLADKFYNEFDRIKVKNMSIKYYDGNCIMKIKDKEYIILLTNKKNYNKKNYYDIIDFNDDKCFGFFIIGDRIITY